MSNLLPSTPLLQDSTWFRLRARLRVSISSSVFCSKVFSVAARLRPPTGSGLCAFMRQMMTQVAGVNIQGLSQHLFSLVLVFCCMFFKVANVSISPYEGDRFRVLTAGGGGIFSAALRLSHLWSGGVHSLLTRKSFTGPDLSFRLGGFVFAPLVVPSAP